jgi:putative methylase
MIGKSQLAIQLSRLKVFDNPANKLEQYPTDSEVAAEILWKAFLEGDVGGRTIADLGSGTGILSYGCLVLGAKKVYLVEKEEDACRIARENLKSFRNFSVVCKDVEDFNEKVDVVIQNPPFGTRIKHADVEFLEKAMQVSKKIYSIHKTSTSPFIIKFAKKKGFAVKEILNFSHPLKNTYRHHKKPIQRIEVSCFILEKINS